MVLVDTYCKGEILGNPDISGKGVVYASWLTAALVILLSFWLWVLLYFTTHPEESFWFRPLTKTLLALGDTQLITALALSITSLLYITVGEEKRDEDTSLYHVFVTRGLFEVNMSGYGSSLILSMGTINRRSKIKNINNYEFTNFGFLVRWALLLVALVVYLVWNEFCIEKFENWSSEPPLCFQNENIVPGEYQLWMSVQRVWFPLGFGWMLCQPFDTLRKSLDWVEDELPTKPRQRWTRICDTWQQRQRQRRRRSGAMNDNADRPLSEMMNMALSYLLLAGQVALLVLSVFGILFAIVTVTPPFYTPFAELFFFVWSVYNVYKVRQVNAAQGLVVACPSKPDSWTHCKENPEEQLGFGQILPFCLLLNTVLQLADMYSESKEAKKKISVGNVK